MLRFAVLVFVAGLVVAGCGVRNSKPFTADGTAPCLEKKGFTAVTTAPRSFVAALSENGGLQATSPAGNRLTIAFAADADSAPQTESAFRLHATGTYKKHIDTVMSSNRNAVLVWTVTPDSAEMDTAVRCLQP